MYPTETSVQPLNVAISQVTFQLTKRERELVRCLARGLSNRQIAQEFQLSEQTVKNQLTAVYQKLNIRSRLQLAMFAVRNDLA